VLGFEAVWCPTAVPPPTDLHETYPALDEPAVMTVVARRAGAVEVGMSFARGSRRGSAARTCMR